MTRLQTKLEMVRLRRTKIWGMSVPLGTWMCDHCGNHPATDMHECIMRSRVMFAPEEIQELIFQMPLCGLLCQGCHSKATTPQVIRSIEKVNEVLFGREEICEALERIPEKFRTGSLYGTFGSV